MGEGTPDLIMGGDLNDSRRLIIYSAVPKNGGMRLNRDTGSAWQTVSVIEKFFFIHDAC